jgi:hypothetical protein
LSFRAVKYPFAVFSLSTFLLMACILASQIHSVDAGRSKSPYSSGYDHGCDDAEISDPSDRYINEPGKGPSFHTDEFMSGYYAGFNACLGTGYQPPPQQPRLYQPPIQRNPPVIV